MLIRLDSPSFYAIQSVKAVIKFDEGWCVDLISVFPSVVAFGVALPFDQILQGLTAPPPPVCVDVFHFVFFFPINQIRRRSHKVWSV
jgi:hypothetical protein